MASGPQQFFWRFGFAVSTAVLLLLLLLLLASPLDAGEIGACDSDLKCPDYAPCCSKWNFCGSGEDYCGDGCQSGPCWEYIADRQMGRPLDGLQGRPRRRLLQSDFADNVGDLGACAPDLSCPDYAPCCSQWNFCGSGDEYCGDGCKAGPCYDSQVDYQQVAWSDDDYEAANDRRGRLLRSDERREDEEEDNVGDVGACAPDLSCPDYAPCCSKWNFCGLGDEYCGEGCKAGPCWDSIVEVGACAPDLKCPYYAPCCSQWNFCGSGDEYCGDGCKAGPCYDSQVDYQQVAWSDDDYEAANDRRGRLLRSAERREDEEEDNVGDVGACDYDLSCPYYAPCCSKWGFCGLGDDYCGEGCKAGPCWDSIVEVGACAPDLKCPYYAPCCSQWNFCGSGDEYCGDGCKAGPCWAYLEDR